MTGRERDALEAIDEAGLVADLRELVAIPSVTGSPAESDAQRWMSSRLDAEGMAVDLWPIDLRAIRTDPEFPGMEAPRDEAWGLVGRLGEGGPTLVLNGHVDVVPPGDRGLWTGGEPFDPRLAEGRVFGRGACDMKGGVVCALQAVAAVRRAGIRLRGSVLFQSVVGEEDGGLGTFATLRRGHRGDAAIIPEPTALEVVPACAGALTFRIRVPGRSAHASMRKQGQSAVSAFWPVFAALERMEARRNSSVDPLMAGFDPAYPLSIGIVRAGDWASSVPDSLVAEGRIGVALGEPPDQTRRQLEAAVEEACEGDAWLRRNPATVEWFGGQFASGGVASDHPLVGLVESIHADLHGSRPAVHGAPYGSDLRLMTGIGGIPTLHYGPGDIALAHAPDEHVEVTQLVAATRALVLAILRFCGTSP